MKLVFKYKNLLIYTVLILISFPSFSQQNYTITNYTVDEGLSQSSIYSIIQDNRGFIWFATYGGGLCRFDGVKFKTFTKEDGLPDNKIYALHYASNGLIWVGTRNGIARYDGYNFEKVDLKTNGDLVQIRDIVEDKSGSIWLATYGNGLFKINTNNHIYAYGIAEGLPTNYLYSIEHIVNNEILIGTRNGLTYFDGKRFTKYDADNEHKQNTIRKVVNTPDKGVWYGAYGGGLCNLKDNVHQCVSLDKETKEYSIMTLLHAKDGTIWVGTFGRGIYKITNDSVYNINFQNSALSTNNILSLFEDNLGNIWAGTYLGGICKITETPFYSFTKKDGLKDPSVDNIYELKDGTILMTLMSGGIMKFNNGKIDDFKPDIFSGHRITSIIEDYSGTIWLGSDGAGVFKLKNNKIQQINSLNNELFSDQIFSIEQTSDSAIWLGTYGDGIIQLKNNQIKTFKKEYERELKSNQIIDIKEDSKGIIWFATSGGGIVNYDGVNFKNFNLKVLDFVSIKLDMFDNIWFASNGGGVFMYNGYEFQTFTTKDGIMSDNVNLINFDNANNLWVGTEKGINKIIFELKDTLDRIKYIVNNIESYSKEDGLVGVETNQGAVLKDRKGDLWFGTIKGVSRYNPKADKFNIKPPSVQFTSLKLFDKPTNWLEYTDSIYPWNQLPVNLSLPYNNNNLTFEYVGINLNVPHSVEYKYMLEGFDEEWILTKRDFVTYSNLPSGNFTFKIIAKNEDGVWQREPTTYSFYIDNPVWLKWWFIALISILLFTIIYIIVKRREAEIRRQNLKLEKTVNERTLELQKEKATVEKINIEVEKKNEQILDSIQYAKKIQMAILPPDELVREKLPHFGIFYEAKDIVSGDFYWLTEENNVVYFATVDCTGHGVPGAFMSIVGYRLLELIISGYHITEPAQVLDELHMQVLETLHKQKGNARDVSDGMDIALCAWDKNNNTLKYAGAHNPLYLIRNGELIEYPSDARPIGMSLMKEFKKFKQHEIQLQKNDIIYIFTDGFADQFGGEKYRKYYYQNFQNLLLSISSESMEKQNQLLKEEFYRWKGDYEQIDDVLVFGVKF